MHIDGYNLLPYLTGEADESPRKGFIYFTDDGDLVALRFDNWKIVFMEQRCRGTLAVLGRAVHAAASPEALQPAHRPVRAGRHDLEHLLGLVLEKAYMILGRAGRRGRVPRDVQGVPAAAEGGELHDRPGAGEDGDDAERVTRRSAAEMARVPAGTLRMGSDDHYPEEAPTHRVSVGEFSIDRFQVTNRDFADFVAATGYATVAERPLDPAGSRERRRRTSCRDRWCSR